MKRLTVTVISKPKLILGRVDGLAVCRRGLLTGKGSLGHQHSKITHILLR